MTLPPSTTPRTRRRTAAGVAVAACVTGLSVLVAPVGPAAAAGPVAAAQGRERLATTTAQVTMNNSFPMKAKLQREDIATVTAMADVVGWQEIANPAQQDAIRDQQGWATYWPDGFRDGSPSRRSANQSPISYRTDKWQRIAKGTRQTSNPVKDVAGDRWISWVVLRDRQTGIKVARWNLHFVPGAWTSKGSAAQKRNRDTLKKEWRNQRRVTLEVIGDLATRAHAVIGGGDVNRIRFPFLGDAVVYDATPMSLDHLVHVANRRTTTTGMTRHDVNSDHPAVRVTYDLNRWRPRGR